MKTLASVAVLIFLSAFINHKKGNGDVILYWTYDDFVNNKGENIGAYKSSYHTMGVFTHKFKGDNGKTKIKRGDAWGYKYKGAYFRFSRDKNHLARIISAGDIILYSNGFAQMEMLEKNTDEAVFYYGYYFYVSKDLKSDVIPMVGKDWKDFKKENASKYKDLFDCLDEKGSSTTKCVDSYNKRNKG